MLTDEDFGGLNLANFDSDKQYALTVTAEGGQAARCFLTYEGTTQRQMGMIKLLTPNAVIKSVDGSLEGTCFKVKDDPRFN